MGRSKSKSQSPSITFNVSKNNNTGKSPRSRSRSKSKKSSGGGKASSKGCRGNAYLYVLLAFKLTIFLLALGALLAPHFLPPDPVFYACDHVYERDEHTCYFARDLSGIGMTGYKSNSFQRNSTWKPIGCNTRINLMLAAMAVTICGIVFSFVGLILIILYMFNVFRSKIAMLAAAILTLIFLVVAFVLMVVVYAVKMCKAHFFIEDDAMNLTELMIGPGLIFLLVCIVLEIFVIIFIIYL